jgi:hypothetical protein
LTHPKACLAGYVDLAEAIINESRARVRKNLSDAQYANTPIVLVQVLLPGRWSVFAHKPTVFVGHFVHSCVPRLLPGW